MPIADNYKSEFLKEWEKQDKKGLQKYGEFLEESKADTIEKLNHIIEESIDRLRYLFWLRDDLQRKQEQEKNCKTCRDYRDGCIAYNEVQAKVCRDCGFVHWKKVEKEESVSTCQSCGNCKDVKVYGYANIICKLSFKQREECILSGRRHWKPKDGAVNG